ncbi:hypothetical protein G6F66_014726 [Rhizopus arrhizus]|nr:hypothetical protein G6F66_014726 [Rhizopus arrhizus]
MLTLDGLQRVGALSQSSTHHLDTLDRRLQIALAHVHPPQAAGAGRGYAFQVGDRTVLIGRSCPQLSHAQRIVRRRFLQRRNLARLLSLSGLHGCQTLGLIALRLLNAGDLAGLLPLRRFQGRPPGSFPG